MLADDDVEGVGTGAGLSSWVSPCSGVAGVEALGLATGVEEVGVATGGAELLLLPPLPLVSPLRLVLPLLLVSPLVWLPSGGQGAEGRPGLGGASLAVSPALMTI